jgi:ParB family chromosome partitioning protein
MNMKLNKAALMQKAATGANQSIDLAERMRQASEAARGTHPLAAITGAGEVPAAPAPGEPAPAPDRTAQAQPERDLAATPYGTVTPAGNDDDKRRGRFETVLLSLVDPNPYNARQTYTATVRNGRYVLAAGHYRRLGLLHIHAASMDKATIDLIVKPNMSDRELYEASYRENAERQEQTSYDNALAWKKLLEQGVYENETALSEAVGMSLPNVNKTLAALRLSPAALTVIESAPAKFALGTLYELALFEEVAGTERTVAMATQVLEERLGRDQINEARKQLVEPKLRKRKETSRPYPIFVGNKYEGTLKEWPNGKVTLEVNIGDASMRDAFVASLREKFGVKS